MRRRGNGVRTPDNPSVGCADTSPKGERLSRPFSFNSRAL